MIFKFEMFSHEMRPHNKLPFFLMETNTYEELNFLMKGFATKFFLSNLIFDPTSLF